MQILSYANPIVNAFGGADLFGKLIFIGLFALSISTWMVLIQKILNYRECHRLGLALAKRCENLDLNLRADGHPFGRLYTKLQKQTATLIRQSSQLEERDLSLLRAHFQKALCEESPKLEKQPPLLATVTSLAPFLGLLGTVWGILLTFAELQGGAHAQASSAIMGGLAMALGTTVLGLLVAIPSLVGYTFLRAKARNIVKEMENFGTLMLAAIERNYCR